MRVRQFLILGKNEALLNSSGFKDSHVKADGQDFITISKKGLKNMQYQIRKMTEQEYPLLEDFLYESLFVPQGKPPFPRSILQSPELQVYTADFGSSRHDIAFVADVDGKVVGAAWVRIMNDYGHIDDETPSLAIALYKEYRGMGMGTALLQELLSFLKTQGYSRVSLSAQKANQAVNLYRRAGFEIYLEREKEYIMAVSL